jgi:hypothetical protein
VLVEAIGTKKCSKCGEIKLLSDFDKHKHQKDGLCTYCKKCRQLKDEEYYKNNRDKASQRKKEYYQSNRDRVLQHLRKYRRNNRESISQYHKEYRQKNPDKLRAKSARRRATKRNATPPWADQAAINAIYAEALWLQDFTGELCHVDHIVPLKSDFVCGLHVPVNLQTLPGVENLSKSNRSWPGQLPCQTRRGINHQWWKELYAQTIALEA